MSDMTKMVQDIKISRIQNHFSLILDEKANLRHTSNAPYAGFKEHDSNGYFETVFKAIEKQFTEEYRKPVYQIQLLNMVEN